MRPPRAAVRIFVELLFSDEIHLDAKPPPVVAFPNRIQGARMRGRQRYGSTNAFVGVEFRRSCPRVRGQRDKPLTAVPHQQLRSRRARAVRSVEKLYRAVIQIFRDDRLENNRTKDGSRDLNRSEDPRDVERRSSRALGAQAAKWPQTRQPGLFRFFGEWRWSKCASTGGD